MMNRSAGVPLAIVAQFRQEGRPALHPWLRVRRAAVRDLHWRVAREAAMPRRIQRPLNLCSSLFIHVEIPSPCPPCRRERPSENPPISPARPEAALYLWPALRLRIRHSTNAAPNDISAQVEGSGMTVRVPVD